MASVRAVVLLLVLVLVGTSVPAGFPFTSPRVAASAQDVVRLASGSTVALQTPEFIQVGRRYAFTWAGGGPAQTYTVKQKRADGWVLVEVADENTDPVYFVPGELPTRWLHVATAISIQEMRPHQCC